VLARAELFAGSVSGAKLIPTGLLVISKTTGSAFTFLTNSDSGDPLMTEAGHILGIDDGGQHQYRG
jgi:hypothetical protein